MVLLKSIVSKESMTLTLTVNGPLLYLSQNSHCSIYTNSCCICEGHMCVVTCVLVGVCIDTNVICQSVLEK